VTAGSSSSDASIATAGIEMRPPTDEVPLAQLGRGTTDFVGRTVAGQGLVRGAGEAAEGVWFDVDGTVLLVPSGAPASLLHEIPGQEVRIVGKVNGPVRLADGRDAVSLAPEEVLVRPARRAAAPVSPPLPPLPPTRFFVDPRLPSGENPAPRFRIDFVDQQAPLPIWTVPGPTSVLRSGTAEDPTYRFTSQLGSEDGSVKHFECDYVVRDGKLRNSAYRGEVRDPTGTILEEKKIDFLGGKFLDKLSGETFAWPENAYADDCVGFALSGFPFGENGVVQFFLSSEYDPVTPMFARLDGVEAIDVPAGRFECFRLKMNFSAERMLKSLALPSEQAYQIAASVMAQRRQPDNTFWLTKGWPHVLVKMEGRLGAPDTSWTVMELLALDDPTRAVLAQNLATAPQ
jgi:hypothetical protein